MPTRFWELGAGVLVSLFAAKNLDIGKRLGIYRLLVLLVLGFTFFQNSGTVVLSQMIAVMATSYLIFPGSNDITSKFLSNNKITWIGVRSYSIYLIHWPILVLTNYLFGCGVLKNLLCIVVTILLSALMYRFIENPFRAGRFKVSAKVPFH
jgi:peptidoglycan/LPS O-acetylase OafA/YrhL